MKSKVIVSALLICTIVVSSCTGKKDNNQNIITHKEQPSKKVEQTQKVGDYTQTTTTKWLGNTYKVQVVRKAATKLPLISQENSNSKYYDNEIELKVMRSDGSIFFSKSFTKDDFAKYVDASFMKKSALLGIVLDHAESNYLIFAASVGLPDRLSDEYIPLVLKISNQGSLSISNDTQLDTESDKEADEN